MKRDFLKNLGIEDKDIIDKILDENSTDIGRAKGEVETLKNTISTLKNDIATKDGEIATLQGKVGNVDELNNRITQLETDKNNLTNELNTKVSQIQKTHAIEGKIRDAKGKNVKAIMALLDVDKITYENGELGGIDDQLTALASAEDSSMLFGDAQHNPTGFKPNDPPFKNNGGNNGTGKSFTDAIVAAINSNK